MMKLDLEVDSLNERCDNLYRIVADLARMLGQSEFANEMIKFHNESVRRLNQDRAALEERDNEEGEG